MDRQPLSLHYSYRSTCSLAIHAIHICTGISKHPRSRVSQSWRSSQTYQNFTASPQCVRSRGSAGRLHTYKSVIKSRATSAPTSCSPVHAMACRHKKHAKKHWHEDSYIRDTSKCSPKGGREEGCGCMCSKFLSSSWGDLTCVWRKHDHSKTCSEYTTSVELSMRWLLDRRRLPRQCFNSFTVCCQFSSPPHQ